MAQHTTMVLLSDVAYVHLMDLVARYGWCDKQSTILRGLSDLLNHLANPRISRPHDWLDTRPYELASLDSMNEADYNP